MVAVIIVVLLLIAVIGLLRERDARDRADAEKTMAEANRKYKDMEAAHKARVERIQKQMDETRNHMDEW